MTTSRFDRVRPRTAGAEAPQTHDLEGKRALFSSTSSEAPPAPARGAVEVECSRCNRTTVLAPPAALRLTFPALHLGLGIRHGDRETMLGLLRRRHPSWVRCPACGHGAWVRVTIRV